MSSSVPSSAFVMQHLRNDRLMVSVEMAFQLSRIHWQIWRKSGFRMRPAGVNVWFPASIHSFQYCLKLSLKGLLTPTSKGCKRLVIPPGITATSVREFFKTRLTLSLKWALNESHTRRFLFRRSPPTLVQTEYSQSYTSDSSIHPLAWARTWIPRGSTKSFGRVFRLNTT